MKIKKATIFTLNLKETASTISELEKNEKIDKNLLRFLTIKVKKFDLDKDYFKKETNDKKEYKVK